jgi:hypothetical protein
MMSVPAANLARAKAIVLSVMASIQYTGKRENAKWVDARLITAFCINHVLSSRFDFRTRSVNEWDDAEALLLITEDFNKALISLAREDDLGIEEHVQTAGLSEHDDVIRAFRMGWVRLPNRSLKNTLTSKALNHWRQEKWRTKTVDVHFDDVHDFLDACHDGPYDPYPDTSKPLTSKDVRRERQRSRKNKSITVQRRPKVNLEPINRDGEYIAAGDGLDREQMMVIIIEELLHRLRRSLATSRVWVLQYGTQADIDWYNENLEFVTGQTTQYMSLLEHD